SAPSGTRRQGADLDAALLQRRRRVLRQRTRGTESRGLDALGCDAGMLEQIGAHGAGTILRELLVVPGVARGTGVSGDLEARVRERRGVQCVAELRELCVGRRGQLVAVVAEADIQAHLARAP